MQFPAKFNKNFTFENKTGLYFLLLRNSEIFHSISQFPQILNLNSIIKFNLLKCSKVPQYYDVDGSYKVKNKKKN